MMLDTPMCKRQAEASEISRVVYDEAKMRKVVQVGLVAGDAIVHGCLQPVLAFYVWRVVFSPCARLLRVAGRICNL
jgi:hypothetical protein